jgi:5-methyltetrahydropteroyltriglutamate--homocysteine methyltransferase
VETGTHPSVGRENITAGVDCGLGTFADRVQVDSKIVWLKLQSLTESARLPRSSCGRT